MNFIFISSYDCAYKAAGGIKVIAFGVVLVHSIIQGFLKGTFVGNGIIEAIDECVSDSRTYRAFDTKLKSALEYTGNRSFNRCLGICSGR